MELLMHWEYHLRGNLGDYTDFEYSLEYLMDRQGRYTAFFQSPK